MKHKWLIRLPVYLLSGGAALMVARLLFPSGAVSVSDFKLPGVLLTALAGVLVVVDLSWSLVSRKLDEPFSSGSPLTAREKDRWRRMAFQAERDLLFNLYSTICLKVAVLALGAGLGAGLIPPSHCRLAAQAGFFLLGTTLPTVFLMPAAYLSARRAKIELAAYEEELAERTKALQELNAAPAHNFQSDPQYVEFGRVIAPKL